MEKIKLSLICTAALMLAIPFAGCMGGGDSGNAAKQDVEPRIETQLEENEDCPDGKCPEKHDGNVDKLPEDRDGNGGKCPDGKCPARLLPPNGRHDNGRVSPIPHTKKVN